MTPVIEQDPDHVEAEETSDDAPLTKGDLKDMFNSLREDVTKEVEDHMKETVEVVVEKIFRVLRKQFAASSSAQQAFVFQKNRG